VGLGHGFNSVCCRAIRTMTQTLAPGSDTDNDPEGSRRIVTVLISILINIVFGNPAFPRATFTAYEEFLLQKNLRVSSASMRMAKVGNLNLRKQACSLSYVSLCCERQIARPIRSDRPITNRLPAHRCRSTRLLAPQPGVNMSPYHGDLIAEARLGPRARYFPR
jgi:hypothetical protein